MWAALATAQFVPAPTNLLNATGYLDIPVRYKEVPTGICELDPDVKSYSGYVDVAENEHYFFWFFESRNTPPEDAPLTVWSENFPHKIHFDDMGVLIPVKYSQWWARLEFYDRPLSRERTLYNWYRWQRVGQSVLME